MQRITDPTAVATLPPPPALTGRRDISGPRARISSATRFRYWVANMWQEERCRCWPRWHRGRHDRDGVQPGSVVHPGVSRAVRTGAGHLGAEISWCGRRDLDRVEVWGGARDPGLDNHDPRERWTGGGYARKRISGRAQGRSSGDDWSGGAAGTTRALRRPAYRSSFGLYCSAGPGLPNPLNSTSSPSFGTRRCCVPAETSTWPGRQRKRHWMVRNREHAGSTPAPGGAEWRGA